MLLLRPGLIVTALTSHITKEYLTAGEIKLLKKARNGVVRCRPINDTIILTVCLSLLTGKLWSVSQCSDIWQYQRAAFDHHECHSIKHKTMLITSILTLTLCSETVLTWPSNDFTSILSFPVVPDCQQKNISLIFVTDASSTHYVKQLEMVSEIVDIFSSTEHENVRHLQVGMAASGPDISCQSEISWILEPQAISEPSAIKEAIMSDRDRPGTESLCLKEAVDFVHSAASGAGVENPELIKGSLSNYTTSTEQEKNITQTGPGASHRNTLTLESTEGKTQFSLILILAFAGEKYSSHLLDGPDPENFDGKKKLVFVLLNSKTGNIGAFPCGQGQKHLCIRSSTTEDHSLSITLCGRCLQGRIGPIPDIAKSQENPSFTGNNSVLVFSSCYKLLPPGPTGNYAINAFGQCAALNSLLVSIETDSEAEQLISALTRLCLTHAPGFEDCSSNNIKLFIGLLKNTYNLGKRFLWVNGRPLIYPHRIRHYLHGGLLQGCTVWNLDGSELARGQGKEHFEHLGKWEHIECHETVSAMTMCEKTILLNPEITKPALALPGMPSERSIQQAISRAPVGKCRFTSGDAMVIGSQFLMNEYECSILINKAGREQEVRTPLPRDKLFSCETIHLDTVKYSDVCDQKRDCPNYFDENDELCDNAYQSRVKKHRRTFDFDYIYEFGQSSEEDFARLTWFTEFEANLFGSYPRNCAFVCNVIKCIPWTSLGDGIVDCIGPEGPLDETLGAFERAECGESFSTEWAPKCIYQKDRLGELIGCRNMHHLHDCENFSCPEGYVKCPGAYCIPFHYLRDSSIDCPMGEDDGELFTIPDYPKGYFKCTINNEIFVHPDRICDGAIDCEGGTDELDCYITCADGFLCMAGFVVPDDYDRSQPLSSLSFIDPRTSMVQLSGINLSSVFSTIASLDLEYIVDLRLSNCNLSDVLLPEHSLVSLLWLDLSYNLFENFSCPDYCSYLKPIFYQSIFLRSLNLSHNAHLVFFDPEIFSYCPNLKVLDLSYTSLATFPDMKRMPSSIRHLNLSHTRITRIGAYIFPDRPWIMEVLDLRGIIFADLERDAFGPMVIKTALYGEDFRLCCPQLRGSNFPAHVCHTPADPLSSCSNLVQNPLLRILVWIMGVASVVANLGVIGTRVAAGKVTLQKPYTQFVTHLGVSDLLMGIYLLIIASKDVQFSGNFLWHHDSWRNSRLCKIAGFLSTLSSEVSSMFILLITADRFLMIKYPFGQHQFSMKSTIIYSVLAWSVGLTIATIPVLPFTKHWEIFSSNAVCLGLPLLAERRPGWQFSVAIFIVLNFLLCVLIAIGQLAIYRAVSVVRREAPVGIDYTVSNSSGHRTPRMKQDVALARRLATVAFTDLLCWLPIGVLGFLALGGHVLGGEAYAWAAVFVMPVNSALNPLLYSLPTIRARLAKAVAQCIAPLKRGVRK
ncbi:relaxin receptor-like protein [Plakobranchus ocellatus]|uniref:Relaxin receptor-like protein n=1 Tax=Plakobranchus ocellatus TaxID=259542 RepID=A0AAV4DYL2_9GAST|nr:relaxin receptor-like protein [Plakobranchus ocellatus]